MRSAFLAMSTFLGASLQPGAAMGSDLAQSATCRQEIRSIDDQADADFRGVNRLIATLEGEIGKRAKSSGEEDVRAHDQLRVRLEAAKLRRSSILDKQHDDLNAVRARCDRLRDGQQGVTATLIFGTGRA